MKLNLQKVLKGIVPFITVFVLLITCVLPQQVNASETSGDFFNVLDYATLSDTGSNYFSFSGHREIRYDLPYSKYVSYVDIVFISVKPITRVVLDMNSATDYEAVELPVDLVYREPATDYYVYRICTDIPFGRFYSIFLDFYTEPGVLAQVEIVQFRTASLTSVSKSVLPFYKLEFMQDVDLMIDTSDSEFGYSWSTPGGAQVPYTLEFWYFDYYWRKYDELELLVLLSPGELDSIFCTVGDTIVDFELVSYEGTAHPSSFIDSLVPDSEYTFYSLKIDLTSVVRDTESSLVVSFTGQPLYTYGEQNPVNLLWGRVLVSTFSIFTSADIDSDVTWWHALGQWFSDLGKTIKDGFDSITNLFSGSSDTSNLDNKNEELEDTMNDLNGAQDALPDVPSDVGTLVDTGLIDNSVTLLSTVFNYEAMGLGDLLTVTGTLAGLAVVCYVLFGKRG